MTRVLAYVAILMVGSAAFAHPIAIIDADLSINDGHATLAVKADDHNLEHLDLTPAELPARLADSLLALDVDCAPMPWHVDDMSLSCDHSTDARALVLRLDPDQPLARVRYQLQLLVTVDGMVRPTCRLTSDGNVVVIPLVEPVVDRLTSTPFDRAALIIDTRNDASILELRVPLHLLAPAASIQTAADELETWLDRSLCVTSNDQNLPTLERVVELIGVDESRAEMIAPVQPCIWSTRLAARLTFPRSPESTDLHIQLNEMPRFAASLDCAALIDSELNRLGVLTSLDSSCELVTDADGSQSWRIGRSRSQPEE